MCARRQSVYYAWPSKTISSVLVIQINSIHGLQCKPYGSRISLHLADYFEICACSFENLENTFTLAMMTVRKNIVTYWAFATYWTLTDENMYKSLFVFCPECNIIKTIRNKKLIICLHFT